MERTLTPGASLDYGWDWTDWLAAGDAIASHTVEVSAPLLLGATSRDGATVAATLSMPTTAAAGYRGVARCQIVTTAGRRDSRDITIVAGYR